MNNDRFRSLIDETFEKILGLSATKGKEYTDGSKDRLENFKGEGASIGLRPTQIWSVYASKHFRSIQAFIRNGDVVSSNEPIEGRIDDLILYLLLLKALLEDKERGEYANSPD